MMHMISYLMHTISCVIPMTPMSDAYDFIRDAYDSIRDAYDFIRDPYELLNDAYKFIRGDVINGSYDLFVMHMVSYVAQMVSYATLMIPTWFL